MPAICKMERRTLIAPWVFQVVKAFVVNYRPVNVKIEIVPRHGRKARSNHAGSVGAFPQKLSLGTVDGINPAIKHDQVDVELLV